LFDLKEDPWEFDNIADDEAYASVRDDLRKRLAQWMKETDDPLLAGPVASPFYERSVRSLAP
jgi:hypothetical protein